MEYHFTTKTFSFFSNLEQTQHLTKVLSQLHCKWDLPMAFLESKHLEIYDSHQYWRFFHFLGLETHTPSIIIRLGFLEGLNISEIMLRITM
jgi:hypothetical protein